MQSPIQQGKQTVCCGERLVKDPGIADWIRDGDMGYLVRRKEYD